MGQVPESFQGFIQPFVAQFDQAFANAMSLAIANTFWIAVGATALGLMAGLFMRELPLRRTSGAEQPAAASSV